MWEPSAWLAKVMAGARIAAGLPSLRTQDLRMAAASNFYDAGFSHAQVQKLLGHAPGSAVTESNYIRPTEDIHFAEREAIRANSDLGPRQRLDALGGAWLHATGAEPFRR